MSTPTCGCRGCGVAYKEGYATGLTAAAAVIAEYEEERYTKGADPTMADDIVAVLRVLEKRIIGMQKGQP